LAGDRRRRGIRLQLRAAGIRGERRRVLRRELVLCGAVRCGDMELSTAVALVVAIALVALGMAATGWLQRAEARRVEVRRLAWQAKEEVEVAEREEEAYYYGQYGGELVSASDVPEAPPVWPAPEVPPSPKEAVVEDEVAVAVAVAASPPAGKSVCAMCASPTTLRCKRCKSVKYWSVSSPPPALVFIFRFVPIMLLHCPTAV
jgi:ubiquitin carboxyl-terminal hydrolase 36/42